MKVFIIIVIFVVLVGTAFWAGYKTGGKADSTPTPSQTAQQSISPIVVAPASTTPPTPPLIDKRGPEGDSIVGNRSGNFAPDFRLKNLQGGDVSLRDYLGKDPIRLIFSQSGELQFQAGPQNLTLRDPEDSVHHLYGVTSMPYTVEIDEHGIIR